LKNEPDVLAPELRQLALICRHQIVIAKTPLTAAAEFFATSFE
jgi:hypothetical protein